MQRPWRSGSHHLSEQQRQIACRRLQQQLLPHVLFAAHVQSSQSAGLIGVRKSSLRSFASLPIELFVGKTPEIIEASKAVISVSGSVSMELLYRAKPTVIVYRTNRLLETFIRPLLTAKYITLVNLLADRMLFPEFARDRCDAPAVAQAILHWLSDEKAYAQTCRELLSLREQVAQPGACARAAQRILEALGQHHQSTHRIAA